MGLNASSDEWCYRADLAIANLEGVHKLVDDILIQAPDRHTLFNRLRQVLQKCREHGITISKRKLQIGETIKFAGFIISSKGIEADPNKLAAIHNFPKPTDISSLRSFLGLANQLGQFIPDLAHITANLRSLLQKNTAFTWLKEHDEDFNKCKELLTSKIIVRHFDSSLPTELLTDASRQKGLGYVLLQRNSDNSPRLIQCGSRSLNTTEQRYATIELECLAIQWAMDKCRYYLLGMAGFTVITDHKPLLGTFTKSLQDLTNSRLRRLREKMTPFRFTLCWTAGKTHSMADALSRAPIFDPPEESADDTLNITLCHRIATDPQLQILFDAIVDDQPYKDLIHAIQTDEQVSKLPDTHIAKLFANVWNRLSTLDDDAETLIILDNDRIVVPTKARPHILNLLHKSHSGIIKTRQAAHQLYYWPGMNNSIKQLISNCEACQVHQSSQSPEPLTPTYTSIPMSQVGIDLFETRGVHYLIMVDRYSGFPFVHKLSSLNTTAITKILKSWFTDWGYPMIIRSDNGPQFRGEFKTFCTTNGIRHETSSPYHPKSNGLAESAVKSIKLLLAKCSKNNDDFSTCLAEWRNTPRADGFSPAHMFLGRRQRTQLPTLPTNLNYVDQHEAQENRQRTLLQSKQHYDSRTKRLPDLKCEQLVRIQNPISKLWDAKGKIININENGHSYEIELENKKTIVRNRRFVKPFNEGQVHDHQIPHSTLHDSADNILKPILRRSKRIQENKDKNKHISFTL
jgi:transposase InsO family protein